MTVAEKLAEMLQETNINGAMTYPEKLIFLGVIRELRHVEAGFNSDHAKLPFKHPADQWLNKLIQDEDEEEEIEGIIADAQQKFEEEQE